MRPTIDIIQLQRNVALSRCQQSYQALFMHYYRPLIRFAVTIVHSREAAEEIYSTVFLKLWDLGGALAKVADLSVYVYRSMKNASLNHLSLRKRKIVDIDAIELPCYDTPEKVLLQNELRSEIAVAIRALPAKCQLVYRLIKEDGFSYRQTADILNISVNTVEGHMTTALKKLAHRLGYVS